ncbi:MAG: DUF802 domain-containing protein, partial [Polaromonas sp.]
MNRTLFAAAFLLGAMAIAWVGLGFGAANPLALVMTLIIGTVYGVGALELLKFHWATATLTHALADIPDKLSDPGFVAGPPQGETSPPGGQRSTRSDERGGLDAWLGKLHPSLQNAVRLRVEGERTGLPGPALTPYLVGLLVMLGMLGTFLGMVVTLNGAVFALEGTTDLQTIRSALAAPIKGLGLAFGTSLAGVASSAMLGLISALVRRERLQAGQLLDGRIATVLRGFSLTHQRQETFKALQLQAQALPDMVDKLQTMMTMMERQSQRLNEGLLTNQDHFHGHIKGVYTELAGAVDQSLKDSLTTSARVAVETIKPLAEATLTGMAREAALLHQRMISTTQTQLDALSTRMGASAATMAQSWTTALARQDNSNDKLLSRVGESLQTFSETFEQRSASLVTSVGDSFTSSQANQVTAHQQQLTTWTQSLGSIAATLQREWQQAGAQTLAQQQQLCTALDQTASRMTAQAQAQETSNDKLINHMGESLQAFSTSFQQRSSSLVTSVSESYESLQANQTRGHQQQLATWTQSLESIAATLQREWQEAGAQTLARQQQICITLEKTAQQITGQAQASTSHTLAEITRLLDAAAEAPRAAAEVIGQLREELSSSMARDNAMLQERSHILETLGALLGTINQASAEQRSSIDSLVASSEQLLNRVGSQFAEKVNAESARLSDSAVHVVSSAVEISSLGESFNFAVQLFSQSNEKLIANLQRIEASMDKSMARSDDQLAYYVAQAREII